MRFNKASSAYMALGFELIGLIVVMVWWGRWADTSLGWGGWGLVGGITLAFVGWVTHLYLVVQQLAKQEKSGDTNPE
jgi:F0F1-type ATP synthase assembly protein I